MCAWLRVRRRRSLLGDCCYTVKLNGIDLGVVRRCVPWRDCRRPRNPQLDGNYRVDLFDAVGVTAARPRRLDFALKDPVMIAAVGIALDLS